MSLARLHAEKLLDLVVALSESDDAIAEALRAQQRLRLAVMDDVDLAELACLLTHPSSPQDGFRLLGELRMARAESRANRQWVNLIGRSP